MLFEHHQREKGSVQWSAFLYTSQWCCFTAYAMSACENTYRPLVLIVMSSLLQSFRCFPLLHQNFRKISTAGFRSRRHSVYVDLVCHSALQHHEDLVSNSKDVFDHLPSARVRALGLCPLGAMSWCRRREEGCLCQRGGRNPVVGWAFRIQLPDLLSGCFLS